MSGFLIQLGILLSLATALGEIAHRAGLPRVFGELSAGLVLGASTLGRLSPQLSEAIVPAEGQRFESVRAVAQLGVVLLVAVSGVHLDRETLGRHGAAILMVGFAGLLIPLALGIAAGYWMPSRLHGDDVQNWVFAVFLGVCLSVSAIPVVAKLLLELGLFHHRVGQVIMAAATIDDLAGWLILTIVLGSASAPGHGSAASAVLRTVVSLLLLVFVVSAAIRLLRRTLAPSMDGDGELGMSIMVAVALLAAGMASAMSLEPVIGALIAGSAIGLGGDTDQRWREPLRSVVQWVLAPIFFATAGLRVDLPGLATVELAGLTMALLLLAMIGKLVGGYLGARAGRLGHWEAMAVGFGISARGVIQVIVADVGLRLGLISGTCYTIIVVIAIVTSLLAPPAVRFSMRRVESSNKYAVGDALS